jgi:hypothetical protein|tara:strand:- start:867 stop:1112 length:246 start_codon:yes stop_codon:yes gene_type:complete
MIAEMLILLPLALEKGGGNGVSRTAMTQTKGSDANLAAGIFKLQPVDYSQYEALPQSFQLDFTNYVPPTTVYPPNIKTGQF